MVSDDTMLRFGMKALLLFSTADRVFGRTSSVGGSEACVERVGESPLERAATDDGDDVDIEQSIGQAASILDFLRPSLLEPEVLDGIRSKLVSGELVIIRDAFQVGSRR